MFITLASFLLIIQKKKKEKTTKGARKDVVKIICLWVFDSLDKLFKIPTGQLPMLKALSENWARTTWPYLYSGEAGHQISNPAP